MQESPNTPSQAEPGWGSKTLSVWVGFYVAEFLGPWDYQGRARSEYRAAGMDALLWWNAGGWRWKVEGRALPMVFSPSTCPLPLGSAARRPYYAFCWELVEE